MLFWPERDSVWWTVITVLTLFLQLAAFFLVLFFIFGCESAPQPSIGMTVSAWPEPANDGVTDAESDPCLHPPTLTANRARLTCPDVCRLTVAGWDGQTLTIPSTSGGYVTSLSDLVFSGSVDFPVSEGTTVEVLVGGVPNTTKTRLEMLSPSYIFIGMYSKFTDEWIAFTLAKLEAGNFTNGPAYRFEVVPRLGGE